MSKTGRRIVILIGLVFLILLVAVGVLYAVTGLRIGKSYPLKTAEISIPTDSASVARGRHIARAISICVDCHSKDLGGRVVADDFLFGRIAGRNLTKGEGSHVMNLKDVDYVRAIRYGIHSDGLPLLYMPSKNYTQMSDEDLGAVIAYIKSAPAVDREVPPPNSGPLGRLLFVTGRFDLLDAEVIDRQTKPPVKSPPPGANTAYGEYLVEISGCRDCHKADLKGGPVADAPPGTPEARNLTRGEQMDDWNEADFIELMRNGRRPTRAAIDSFMPWKYYREMTDEELRAIWLYLRTLTD